MSQLLPPDQSVQPAPPGRAAVSPAERWPLPDVLRGGAILGILFVNMQDFAGYDEWTQRGPDQAAQVFIDVLMNGKFVSIFALLFGAGMLMILDRASSRHIGAFRLLRRLLALLVLGALHGALLWHGDVIGLYALTGLLLLPPLLLRPPPWLLALAGSGLGLWWLALRVQDALGASSAARWSYTLASTPVGSYPALVGTRAGRLLSDLLADWSYNALWLLALFLLGMAAQRAGLLARPAHFRRLFRALLLGGAVLGLPLSCLLAWLNTQPTEAAGLWEVPVRMSSGLLLGVAYAAGTALLIAGGRPGVLRHLAAPGRLALSNYLGQSLVMTTVFYPYGLNLYRHVGALTCLLLALSLAALQLLVSGWWLRRSAQGPLEWLLRRLVYGRGALSVKPRSP
ncbi:DUF418 domain-containing protein [Deinococcus sp. KNUC1210]|uniref:DUF418 domain-containing protein n=1 Tax=Deinococcus sp. KNUC1210 TaxID=2917691 RepID=UPI001EF1373E|nr:DUF418 domain-containing protein [Deinococcus sp. KNUC1210]ULH14516.1 DUF418 domain-containing protein [Deinococcus sp. KNUC1210]